MEGFPISKGDRGELLVLFLILARDTTLGAWFGLIDQAFRKQTVASPVVDAKSIHALGMLSPTLRLSMSF